MSQQLKISNINVLTEEYVPAELPAREKELKELLDNTERPIPKNIYLFGDKGLGKTALVTNFIRTLNIQRPDITTIYISCRRTLSETFEQNFPNLPPRRVSHIWFDKSSGKKNTIVFDDVGKLWRKKELSYLLHDLYDSQGQKHKKISAIVVGTMTPRIFDRDFLTEPVVSRYGFNALPLTRYNATQLKAIIQQRIMLGLKGQVNGNAVDFIVSKIERHNSDVRLGIRILANAAYRAEKQEKPLTLEYAQAGWEEEKYKWWTSEIEALHPHVAFLLYLIYLFQKNECTTSREIYYHYQQNLNKYKIKPMVVRQLRTYLDTLEKQGWITIDTTFTPRTGKQSKIQLTDAPQDTLKTIFEGIDWTQYLK